MSSFGYPGKLFWAAVRARGSDDAKVSIDKKKYLLSRSWFDRGNPQWAVLWIVYILFFYKLLSKAHF